MIIIGAGLAGLSAAYNLEGSTIYESATQVGGHAKSHHTDGFTFDEGIHVLHTTNEYVLDFLHGPVNAQLHQREREAWIYHYDTLTRYPYQANTFGLPVEIVKECLVDFIQNDFPQSQVNTYEDWLYYQYGKGISDRFMIPYSQKFWGVHPRELTTQWVSVRHPRPSLDEVITGALGEQKKGFGVNAKFRYPAQGGYGAIAEAIADAVGRDRIHLGMRLTRLDVKHREIEFNGGDLILPYQDLITTVPLPNLVTLIPDVPESILEAAALLRTNSILAVNLGIDRPNLTDKHWIYYPEKDYIFFRISFPMNKAPGMVPPGKSSVSAEIAYGNGQVINRETVVERVVQDLQRSGVLKEDDRIIFQDMVDIKHGYVIYDKNRAPAVLKIHGYLKKQGIFPCGRYGDWGYLWSDEAILSGRRAALALKKARASSTRGEDK